MKRSLVCVLALVCSIPAVANVAEMLPPDGTTVAMLCAGINHARAERAGRIHSNVVSADGADFAFVILIAGNAQGGGGTFFHSDLSIYNQRSTAQRISVAFLRQGTNSGNDPVTVMTVSANSVADVDDFVATKLGRTGIGSLVISGTNSDGSVDTNAMLDGFSRIWTPQPGSSGTVSQSLSSTPLTDVIADSYALGLKQDSRFRTNVGLVNTSANTRAFTIVVNGTNGTATTSQSIPPYSMNQVPIPAGNWGNLSLTVGTAASDFDWWSAYGTTADNVTGDGWVSHLHH